MDTNKRASRKTIADFYNLVDVPATILLRNYRLLGTDDIFYNRQGKIRTQLFKISGKYV